MQGTALTTFGSAFLAGMLLAAPSALLPALTKQRSLPEGPGRRLRFLFFLIFIPVMLLGGVLIDRWGSEGVYETLALGSLLAVVGFGMLYGRSTYRAALGATVLLAVAAACCLLGATLLMPHAFFAS